MSLTSADGRSGVTVEKVLHNMFFLTQHVLVSSPITICIVLHYPDTHYSLHFSHFLFLTVVEVMVVMITTTAAATITIIESQFTVEVLIYNKSCAI